MMADPNRFSLILEPEGFLGASSSRYLKDKPPLWQDVDPDENAAQCDKAIRGTLRKWVHPSDGTMFFSVRLVGSEMWCSKDLGWIIGALQKEHQRALDERRLADYTCEGVEAKLTVKVDFILPQGTALQYKSGCDTNMRTSPEYFEGFIFRSLPHSIVAMSFRREEDRDGTHTLRREDSIQSTRGNDTVQGSSQEP